MHASTNGKKCVCVAAKSVPIVSAAISFSTAIALLTSIILSRSRSSISIEASPSASTVAGPTGEEPEEKAEAASETETGSKVGKFQLTGLDLFGEGA